MAEILKPLPNKFRECLTPQELMLRGEIEEFRGNNRYRPLAVITGLNTPEIENYRQRHGVYLIPESTAILIEIRNPLAISLERLDLKTGITISDPRVLGEWRKDSQTIREYGDRDLTEELYLALAQKNMDLFFRT